METAKVELYNLIERGSAVGNGYLVAHYVDGRRANTLGKFGADEGRARAFAASWKPETAGASCCRWHAAGGAAGPCMIASPDEIRAATNRSASGIVLSQEELHKALTNAASCWGDPDDSVE